MTVPAGRGGWLALASPCLVGMACLWPVAVAGQGWSHYGGDASSQRYSPLEEIHRDNVEGLELAWSWRTGEGEIATPFGPVRPGKFEATPLAFGDTLVLPTPLHRVVALDGRTGEPFWTFDPEAHAWGQIPSGFVHRGLASWSDGSERRLFLHSRWRLIALDARTGRPIETFGDAGVVDLARALDQEGARTEINGTSPPAVYGDLVIVGSSISDVLVDRASPPGAVLAFDIRSGRLVWRFFTTPTSGQPGAETWEGGLERPAGHTNVWAPMTLDERRGLLYLPVSSPTNDWYGGDRLGDNLYSAAVVCLEAASGDLVWYYQTVHHGIWDYDLPAAPNLMTLRPDGGAPVPAVAVVGKTGFVYTFDRVTGSPIWPLSERPVPASDVPGERASPTQPHPSRPPPFARQGFTPDDVIDFTPDLERQARAALADLRWGPIFSPPSLDGTVMSPGWLGGATWAGATFDPRTNTLFVTSHNDPTVARVVPPEPETPEAAARYVLKRPPTLEFRPRRGFWGRLAARLFRREDLPALPIHKPPYANVTAIDMDRGVHRWRVPIGDSPQIRNHPLLRSLDLPALGAQRATGTFVTRSGLLFVGAGSELFALDGDSGETLWRTRLPGRANGSPMTFRSSAGRQLIVIAVGGGGTAELRAYALAGPGQATDTERGEG